MSITFRGGKRDPDPSKPRLRFAAFARPTAMQVPAEVDWCTTVEAPDHWGMFGNDRWGDCVFAGQAHETIARTTLAGRPYIPTDDQALRQYGLVAGFDPADPSTDQGALIQDALAYWRRNGFPAGTAETIGAFAQVDHRDPDQVLAALWLFGSLSIGLQVPDYAMGQHDRGEVWDVQPGGRNLGGHAVHLARAKREGSGLRLWVITWGSVQEVSWAFWHEYMDEAWCSLTSEWLESSGASPSGLDVAALAEQFTAITGEPAPFPTPPPDPVNAPTPADVALWGQVQHWAGHPHLMPSTRTVARHLRDWAAAKGLPPGGS